MWLIYLLPIIPSYYLLNSTFYLDLSEPRGLPNWATLWTALTLLHHMVAMALHPTLLSGMASPFLHTLWAWQSSFSLLSPSHNLGTLSTHLCLLSHFSAGVSTSAFTSQNQLRAGSQNLCADILVSSFGGP